jgi:hypothetical protein
MPPTANPFTTEEAMVRTRNTERINLFILILFER